MEKQTINKKNIYTFRSQKKSDGGCVNGARYFLTAEQIKNIALIDVYHLYGEEKYKIVINYNPESNYLILHKIVRSYEEAQQEIEKLTMRMYDYNQVIITWEI